MSNGLAQINDYAKCIQLAVKICRRPGGGKTLLNRMMEMEKEIESGLTTNRCDRCGSADLEPTTSIHASGLQVSKFRCKACGNETTC